MLTIGPHISTAKGYANAAKTAAWMGASTFQFFSRNPRGSSFRAYDEKDAAEFQALREAHRLGPLQAHAPYTMNLAGADGRVYEFGCEVVKTDVKRMDALGIAYFVLHPGSYGTGGLEAGIGRIAGALNGALDGGEAITVLLETMSGKGSEVGSRFEELKAIMDRTAHGEKMGVCLDTCHVFSAGYDVKGGLESVLDELDRVLGMDKLKTVHLNDSMTAFGSKKDRHAPIGGGGIGLDAVVQILTHPQLRDLPFFLETPFDDEGHKKEIEMIKNALGSGAFME